MSCGEGTSPSGAKPSAVGRQNHVQNLGLSQTKDPHGSRTPPLRVCVLKFFLCFMFPAGELAQTCFWCRCSATTKSFHQHNEIAEKQQFESKFLSSRTKPQMSSYHQGHGPRTMRKTPCFVKIHSSLTEPLKGVTLQGRDPPCHTRSPCGCNIRRKRKISNFVTISLCAVGRSRNSQKAQTVVFFSKDKAK